MRENVFEQTASMQTFPRRESEWPRAFPDLAAEEFDAFQPRSVISFMTLDWEKTNCKASVKLEY